MKQKRPSVIDLFAGAGGMSLGFESAGFDIISSVEIDPVHSAVHHFNFPYCKTICGDLSNVSSERLQNAIKDSKRKDIDVIVGGAPCQGFSQIGKRQLDDPRNQLVFQYFRVIKDLQPKYFVFENVPGIIAGKHIKFIEELIAEFKKINYNVVLPHKVLDASKFNVAQKRKRFILLGYRKDVQPINYPPHISDDPSLNLSLFESNSINKIPGADNAIGNLSKFDVFIGNDTGINPKKIKYSNYDTKFSFDKKEEFNLCHQRHFDKNMVWGHIGSNHTQVSIDRFQETVPGKTEKISRFFRLNPLIPCNTLRAGTPSGKGAHTAPRPIHYKHPRCISIREAARLHSYPDWFQFHRKIWHGFRQIGNSVAPLFARSIGIEIISALKIKLDKLPIYDLEIQDEKLTNMNTTEAANYFGIDRSTLPTRKRLNKKTKEIVNG